MLTSSRPQSNSAEFAPRVPRPRTLAADFYIDTAFRVIHEDASILVVDKPAPLAVHPVGSYAEKNLHSLLKKDPRWAEEKILFMHRLDAETSGVILIAKNHEASRFIGKEFLAGRVKKRYRALVFGVPAVKEGRIDAKLGHDESSGFQTVRIADEINGEEAATLYRVASEHGDYSWIELEPLTGRTHQLRAHLSILGHPIVGDKIYVDLKHFQNYVLNGMDAEMLKTLKLRRLALHAEKLSFIHPDSREEVSFSSACPDFLKEIA